MPRVSRGLTADETVVCDATKRYASPIATVGRPSHLADSFAPTPRAENLVCCFALSAELMRKLAVLVAILAAFADGTAMITLAAVTAPAAYS